MTETDDYKPKVILALLAGGFKVQAHEDRISSHVPDLSFSGHGVDGWIEVKYLNVLPHLFFPNYHYFTHGQQRWLEEMGAAGSGHCYLLVGIGNEPWKFALFRWSALRGLRGAMWRTATSFCRHASGAGRALSVALHNGEQVSIYRGTGSTMTGASRSRGRPTRTTGPASRTRAGR